MKSMLFSCCFLFSVLVTTAQEKSAPAPMPVEKTMQVVEAACGQCKFGVAGDDCALAVRIAGKTYLVDGSHIDAHGDAHAKDGFCNAVRKARVQGAVVNGRFKATYFKLINDAPDKEMPAQDSSNMRF